MEYNSLRYKGLLEAITSEDQIKKFAEKDPLYWGHIYKFALDSSAQEKEKFLLGTIRLLISGSIYWDWEFISWLFVHYNEDTKRVQKLFNPNDIPGAYSYGFWMNKLEEILPKEGEEEA